MFSPIDMMLVLLDTQGEPPMLRKGLYVAKWPAKHAEAPGMHEFHTHIARRPVIDITSTSDDDDVSLQPSDAMTVQQMRDMMNELYKEVRPLMESGCFELPGAWACINRHIRTKFPQLYAQRGWHLDAIRTLLRKQFGHLSQPGKRINMNTTAYHAHIYMYHTHDSAA